LTVTRSSVSITSTYTPTITKNNPAILPRGLVLNLPSVHRSKYLISFVERVFSLLEDVRSLRFFVFWDFFQDFWSIRSDICYK